ncbi:hypothetical protein, partial [Actinophytocola xanthii]|uniref:hypothetical protein n=1 Tax=Actinophytocola xanthii TaxID=1912961 RepID=UPI001E35A138
MYETIADTSWRMGIGLAEVYAAFELRLQGDIDHAVQWAVRAAERCPIGRTVFGPTFSGEWAHCAALCGDLDTAARVLVSFPPNRGGLLYAAR